MKKEVGKFNFLLSIFFIILLFLFTYLLILFIYSFASLKISYDPLSSCLVDFQGRATVASVKNFQLIISTPMIDHPVARNRGPTIAWATSDNNTEEDVIFQMGKVNLFKSIFIHNLNFSN